MSSCRPRRAPAARTVRFGSAVCALAVVVLGSPGPAGAYAPPGITERVSLSWDGHEGDHGSGPPAITPDARYVAFYSAAGNLVPEDTNQAADVFVRDRLNARTQIVTLSSQGEIQDNPLVVWFAAETEAEKHVPAITPDGRFVAFSSEALSLVPKDRNDVRDVFVRDLVAGTTERVSISTGGEEANDASDYEGPTQDGLAISADGRFVAFASWATNLAPGDTTSDLDVFVHDRWTGTTELASVSSGTDGNGEAGSPAISGDGRYVFFASSARFAPEDSRPGLDYFVRDRKLAVTELVSVAGPEAPASPCPNGLEGSLGCAILDSPFDGLPPSVSPDGRYVAFLSGRALTGNDAPGPDVFLRDRSMRETVRISTSNFGGRGGAGSSACWVRLAVTADGRYVAFASDAGDIVSGDVNESGAGTSGCDVFVHDRVAGVSEIASRSTEGAQPAGYFTTTTAPALSADGRFLAFLSGAGNLVPEDTNQAADVFVRDRGPALGTIGVEITKSGTNLIVSGSVRLPQAAIGSFSDEVGEIGPAWERVGADLEATRLTYRPELEDLLFELSVASFPLPARVLPPHWWWPPEPRPGPAAPAVVYGVGFRVGERVFEARILQRPATEDPTDPPDPPNELADVYALYAEANRGHLYECAPGGGGCIEAGTFPGGFGQRGPRVIDLAVPEQAIGLRGSSKISELRAFSALGEVATGPIATLDEKAWPGTLDVPQPKVLLGIAPASAGEAQVGFSTAASLFSGRFSGALSVATLHGSYRVWVKVCMSSTCASQAVATVSL